jgi:hypothetical protein
MSDDDQSIRFSCPTCGKPYVIKAELAGKTAKCNCGAKFKIPPRVEPSAASKMPSSAERPSAAAPATASGAEDEHAVDELLSGGLPEIRPFDDADFNEPAADDYELDAPVQRFVPDSVRQAIAAGESAALTAGPRAAPGESKSSWALKFVGVFGLIIMAQTALAGLLLVVATLLYILRPDATLPIGAVLVGFVAFQLMICVIIFRLGKGLVDGERSAVHGLTVLFALSTAASIGALVAMPDLTLPLLVGLAINSAFYLAPISVAYLHWEDFHIADE